MTVLGNVIFTSLTALVRYTYLRSSFQEKIQSVLKRNSFCVQLIILGEGLLILHTISLSQSRDPWPMYNACMHPTEYEKTNIVEIVPIDQIIIHIYHGITIFCNIFLWRYLKKQTDQNTALQPKDRKLCRKRNLVPAKIGIIHLFFYGFIMIYSFFHLNSNMDNGTKFFFNACISDLLFCILSPLIFIILGSQEARHRIRNFFNYLSLRV